MLQVILNNGISPLTVNADNEHLMCLQDKEKNINYGRVDDTYNIIYLRYGVIEFRVTIVKQEHL